MAVVALTGGASDPDSATATGVEWGKVALGVLLLSMAARQWRKRPAPGEEPEMPGWMATLAEFSPVKAAGLGVAVSAANPKNLILTAAAGATIAQAGLDAGQETIAIAVFVVLGSVTVVGCGALLPRRWSPGGGSARRHANVHGRTTTPSS